MCTITLSRLGVTFEVASGDTLMESLLKAGRPVASSCDGEGICGKCRVTVTAGLEKLSPETTLENKLRKQLSFPSDQRLSCQAQVRGNISVDAPSW